MSKKGCIGHKTAILVTKSPVRILAGGKTPGTPIPLGATIVALGVALESPVTGLPTLESRVVRINWPDMSTPDIDAEGWKRIARALAALRKPIYVSCAAGHGRTGTCLAILCHMLGQMPKKVDPVEWVRTVYCGEAVETEGQVAYVTKITGRVSTAKGSMGSMGGKVTSYTGGAPSYEEGSVWDSKTSTWKAKTMSGAFEFDKPKTRYCKGQGDKCPKTVTDPVRFCPSCQEKEGVEADGTVKGTARGTFPEMPKTGKEKIKEVIKEKYFPDQPKKEN